MLDFSRPVKNRTRSRRTDHEPVLEPLLRPAAAKHMQDHGIDAWFTFHIPHSTPNPTALRLFRAIGIKNITGALMGFVYPDRKPVLIVPALEKAHYDYFGKHGEVVVVTSRAELETALRKGMRSCKTVATEYEKGLIATGHSIIPASLLGLIKSLAKIRVVSSGDLVQAQIAVLTPEGLASHERAAEKLTRFVKEAFDFIGRNIGRGITEWTVQQFLVSSFTKENLTCENGPPIVAVNANAANPHYSPEPQGSSVIRKGDLILFDFWAREQAPEAIYADLGWMAYVGDTLPLGHAYSSVFDTLLRARHAAIRKMQKRFDRGEPLVPHLIDAAARDIVIRDGYLDYPHSTGHSITTLVHGEGANISKTTSYRGVDKRLLLPGSLVSVEPGIYIPGKFGMRIEADVYIDPVKGPRPTSEIQREMVFI